MSISACLKIWRNIQCPEMKRVERRRGIFNTASPYNLQGYVWECFISWSRHVYIYEMFDLQHVHLIHYSHSLKSGRNKSLLVHYECVNWNGRDISMRGTHYDAEMYFESIKKLGCMNKAFDYCYQLDLFSILSIEFK